MRVFLSVASLKPAYGGPAFSVSQLAAALAGAGVEVGLWSPDGSALDSPLVPVSPRVRPLSGSPAAALTAFGPLDLLHDSGIWLPHNHALARAAAASGIPRVVSTRGMLEPWALNHRRWKKRLAWGLYQRRDLRSAQLIHATADAEAASLAPFRLGVPVSVVPNGVVVPAELPSSGRAGTTRLALFFGRFHPVKGLPLFLEAWASVRPSGWHLRLAGHDEDGYLQSVLRIIERLGLQSQVTVSGPLDGPAKRDALAAADLFVLPSLSENFGMVVGEALAHAVPVLTTTAVPWPQLASNGCGWSVPPTADGLARGLRDATSASPGELSQMGLAGRRYVAAEFSWDRIAARMIDIYSSLTGLRSSACA